jgi:mRNA interferase YafQ
MRLLTTRRFERDLKRVKKRGKRLEKLKAVTDTLLSGQTLPPRYRVHQLSGNWQGFRECHVEPDWLLIWEQGEDFLILTRTGTHSDLFG